MNLAEVAAFIDKAFDPKASGSGLKPFPTRLFFTYLCGFLKFTPEDITSVAESNLEIEIISAMPSKLSFSSRSLV